MSSITIVSDDATIWSVTYDHHYDNRNSFIIQATGPVAEHCHYEMDCQKREGGEVEKSTQNFSSLPLQECSWKNYCGLEPVL